MPSAKQSPDLSEPTTASKLLDADIDYWAKMTKDLYETAPRPPIACLHKRDTWDVSKYKNKPRLAPAEASQKCADAIEKYDAEECKAYREEIDTLLVFAGLFSAVVTAFTVESYKWLQDDPDDAIIALLSQIANQPPRPKMGLSDAVSSRINTYWFLSLALSLSAALVSILCKQWIREFERHTGLSDAMQFIAIRHMKLQGFESWRVSGVVAAIPLLLQSALGLFAVGAIELLWNLHKTVAIAALVPTAVALLFYALTTSLTAIQAICSPFGLLRTLSQCPFKSPQALLALRLVVTLRIIFSCCNHGWRLLWRVPLGYLSMAIRKCRVFLRRVRIWKNPESCRQLWRETEGVPSSWDRLAFIWNCPEYELDNLDQGRAATSISLHQHPGNCVTGFDWLDADAKPRPVRPFAKFMHTLRSLWSRARRRSPDFPTFTHTKSWIQVDRAFAGFRDHAYTSDECDAALNPEEPSIAPRLFFGGLSWLRDHVHAVDLESWLCLSIWDHIDFHLRGPTGFMDPYLIYGIRAALPTERTDFDYSVGFTRTAPALMVLYAQYAKLEPAFIAEALAHQLPHIEDDLSTCEVLRIFSSGGDHGCWLWILESVLRPQFTISSWDWAYRYAVSPFLKRVPIPEAVSTQTLAALVALRLPYLHREGESSNDNQEAYEARKDLYTLLRLAMARPAHPESDRQLTGKALELSSTLFEALALVVDLHLLQQLREGIYNPDDDNFVAELLRPECQSVYLRLLSAALGSPAVAAEHLDQLLVANREGVAYQYGIPAHPPVPASTSSQRPGSSTQPGQSAEVDPTAQESKGQSAAADPTAPESLGQSAAAAPESEGLTRAEADVTSQSVDTASAAQEVDPSAQDSEISERSVSREI